MNEKHKRRIEAVNKLHEKADSFRGRILNVIAVIERDMAIILTDYFCTADEDKRALFFEHVAGKLSLEKKKRILIEVVKRDYPYYWNENKETLRDLQKIQEFRNKLAHSVIDTTDEAIAKPINLGVSFVGWNDGIPVTEIDVQEWKARAIDVASKLSEIKSLLPFKERPVA